MNGHICKTVMFIDEDRSFVKEIVLLHTGYRISTFKQQLVAIKIVNIFVSSNLDLLNVVELVQELTELQLIHILYSLPS